MSDVTKATIDQVEEQIKDTERDYNYRLVEWPIEVLVKKFVKKSAEQEYKEIISKDSASTLLIVPEYQREFVWGDDMKSKFIESMFMKVPMPPLFAFILDEEGNMELIDGVQRLSTIKQFTDSKLVLQKLEVLDTLNEYSFAELEPARQRKFNSLSLKIYMLDAETDEGVRADIFNRVNSTGEKLKPAEIRKGSYIGNRFYDFILNATGIEEFTALFSAARSDDKLRGEKEELITRFFAYSEKYTEFERSVKSFLDDYIKEKGGTFDDEEKAEKEMQLKRALKFVNDYFPYGFRKSSTSKSIPKVRFESIAIGVNLALNIKTEITEPNLRWLESKEYKDLVTSGSSNNRNKLIGRIEFVRDCLLGKVDINSLTYGN